jgi:hypothetical protein
MVTAIKTTTTTTTTTTTAKILSIPANEHRELPEY